MGVYHAQAPDGTMRVVGQTVDDEFRKRVYRSKHFLRQPPAIAIEATVVDQLEDEFINLIRVRDDERMEYWETPLSVFIKHKFVVDRGHGKQYALPLAWWDVHDKEGVLISPRQRELEDATKKTKDWKEIVEEALKGFKPEFGNTSHIRLGEIVQKFHAETRKKKPSKTEMERLAKSIVSTVEAAKK